MSTVRSVILDLIGRDNASRAFLSASRNAEKAATSMERFGYRSIANGARVEAAGRKMTKAVSLPLLALGAVAVKVAADYEKNLNTIAVATGASVPQMKILSGGIKGIALTTGDSLKSLTDGAYTIQKSTKNAADTVQILTAAAKGAKAENADLGTVTNALTSVMASYNLKGDKAVSTMNMLTRGAGLAKTSVQLFAGSLSNVVPLAASLGVKIPEVFGAIATMTQHGESPERAAQNLNSLISALAGGSNVTVRALQQLKVPVLDFQKNIGKRGITGTLQILLDHMKASSRGGMIVYDSMKQASLGVQSMDIMMGHLTGQALKNAEALRSGKLGVGDYRSEAKKMADGQSNMALQFLAAYQAQTGFNDLLKSGRGNTQTYARALLQAVGGITNMGAVLKLLGPGFAKANGESKLWLDNVRSIGEAGKNNTSINGWSKTLKLFTTQWDLFKSHLQVWLVNMGNKLMPTALSLLDILKGVFDFFGKIGSALPGGTAKFLLLAAALGPVVMLAGKAIKLFGFLYLAIFKVASFSLGYAGITTGLNALNTGAFQAGARMSMLSTKVKGFGSALAGLTAGAAIGSLVKSGGVAGWAESILGGGAAGAALGTMILPGLGTAIGGVTGMISGGIAHWFKHRDAAREALLAEKAWVEQLTSAIALDNGAIGAHTKAMVAKQLTDNGVFDQAAKLHISLATVLSAGMGNTGALNKAITGPENALIARYNKTQDQTAKLGSLGLSATEESKRKAALVAEQTSLMKQIGLYDKLRTVLRANGIDLGKSLAKYNQTAQSLNDLRKPTGGYIAQLKELRRGTSQAVTNNGDLTQSLRQGTVVGDHNRNTLIALGSAAEADAERVFQAKRAHEGLKAATAAANNVLRSHVAQIEKAAVAAGFDSQQVHTLISGLFGLSKQHPKPTISLVDNATARLQNIHDVINSIPTYIPINVTVTTSTVGNLGSTIRSQVPGHHARGGSVADGWFVVGEQGYEMGYKRGNKVQIFPNSLSRKMTGVQGYAKGTKLTTKQQNKLSGLDSLIGGVGTAPSPQFDINSTGANLIIRQLRHAWEKATHSGLPAATVAKLEHQLRHLQHVLAHEMGQLRIKIKGGDLAAIRKAMSGSADDARTAFQGLVADLRHLGTATDGQLKRLHNLGQQFIANQGRLANAKDYNSSITGTLRGTFDATQYGSVSDLLAGMGGQTTQNNNYAKELRGLHRRAKGNKRLNNFINGLAASGQTATLQTLFGASNSQLAQVSRGVGAYNASVKAGGDAATTEKFGATVDKLERTQDRLVRVMDRLVKEMSREKAVMIDGKKVGKHVARHVVHSDEMADVVADLATAVNQGRRNK